MPVFSTIVVQKTTRNDWTARYQDAMFHTRGDTPAEALDRFCQAKQIDRTQVENHTPQDAPPHIQLYRHPLGPPA